MSIITLDGQPVTPEEPPPMSSCIVVITNTGKWGKAKNLESALFQCKRQGAFGSQLVIVGCYIGDAESLNAITVDDKGAIRYPASVLSVPVGCAKMDLGTRAEFQEALILAKCRVCGGVMGWGTAIESSGTADGHVYEGVIQGAEGRPVPLTRCWKCKDCGHSFMR